MPSIRAGVLADQGEHRLGRRVQIAAAPVAGELRVEHVAQPVQDHRLPGLADQVAVDARDSRRPSAAACDQCAAGHQDRAPARGLDRLELLLVGAAHVVQRARPAPAGRCRRRRRGRRPGWCGPRRASGGSARAPRPVQAHAALRGVHGLGDLEAQRPRDGGGRPSSRPSPRPPLPGRAIGQRIGHDVGGGVGDPREGARRRGGEGRGRAEPIVLDAALGGGRRTVAMAKSLLTAATGRSNRLERSKCQGGSFVARDGAAPRGRVTIVDIARAAGVSKSTVSLVLQGSPLVKPASARRSRRPSSGWATSIIAARPTCGAASPTWWGW